jgi:hypothetical protein
MRPGRGYGAEEFAGDVSLEAAADLGVGLALGAAFGDVGVGARADQPAGQSDVVQGAVELAVAAAVEAVPAGSAAGGRDRADAGQRGESLVRPMPTPSVVRSPTT